MKWNDLATAAFLTAVGVLWIWKGLQIPFPSFARIARVGPAHYPVALAVLRTVSDPGFLRNVAALGHRLESGLQGLRQRVSRVTGVRGLGLLQGVVLDGPVAPVIARARTLGLLVVSAGPDVIRLVPPLNTEPRLLDHGLGLLEEAMA